MGPGRRAVLAAGALAVLARCAAQPTPGISPAALAAADDNPLHRLQALRQVGERLAGAPFVAGNRVTLLINGPAAFAALAEAIRSARKRIDMET